ncbi:MAG: YbjN domain-containing protein [Crocinitomicaceae bacterium]|nr:YbjN domain-containing protein [Crocinitomicaceae bacterium]
MDKYFNKVRDYLLDLNYTISLEDENSGMIVVNKEEEGINNLVIGCSDPILIMEQHIFDMPADSLSTYKALLQKNRDIVHGAFVLDETGGKIIFRDTLQLENLDQNELEGSINSLSLLLSEFSDEIISFSKQ